MNKSEEKIYELLKNNELYRDEKGIYTIFPQEYLIEQSGCGGSTIRRILKSLEEQGFIHREWLAKEHLNLFYFSNEDFSGRTIIDINEKSLLKKVSTQKVEQKNCTHSPENEHHSPENEHHSPENEHHSPENCTHSSENYHTLPNNTIINSDKLSSSANNSLKTDENDTSDKELPQIEKTTVPESVLYPLWKPTYEIFNNFPIGKTKKLNMESEKDRRKGKTANLLMLLNFDELKGVHISRTLTIYDKNVWNACANLVKCGYNTVTSAQIYKFMGHTSEPPTSERNKILESISTISRARVYVSNKEEHELYKKYDEILLDTPLLAAEICQAKFGDDIVEEAIRIIEPPKLFDIAEQRGQITTIPFEVLKSPINKNDEVSLITDYLLIRISRMKNNKFVTRTILLDTLCDKCDITDSRSDRMKKSRLPDRLERILSHYKSSGWISDYKLTDREIEIIISDKK